MSATQAATSSGVGGSECRCRSCSRTEPMSIELRRVGRRARRRGSARSSRRRCRRPAPASAGGVAQVADRAVEGERGLLVAGQHLGPTPSRACTPAAKTSALAASRVAEVAQNRIRVDGVRRRPARRTRRSRRTPAPAPRRPAGRSRRRPGRAAPSASRGPRRRAGAPISSLIVLVPQSIAAIMAVGLTTHGPGGPPLAEQVEHLVAERVHAAALRRATGRPARAGTSPGRACRRPRSPSISGTLGPSSGRGAREVALVRGGVRRGQLGVRRRAGPPSPSSARSPRGCRSARPRAGRSGSRSSGTACRRAAAARW